MDTDATLAIPLKYTYFVKPEATNEARIIYQTSENLGLWRDVSDSTSNNTGTRNSRRSTNTKQPLTPFAEMLGEGTEIMDCLPSMRSAAHDINADTKNLVSVDINESRLQENTLTVLVKGPASDINNQRAKILRHYYQVERAVIGVTDNQIFAKKRLSKQFTSQLEAIAAFCKVSIFVTDFVAKSHAAETYMSRSYVHPAKAKPNSNSKNASNTNSASSATGNRSASGSVRHASGSGGSGGGSSGEFAGSPYYVIIMGDQDSVKLANIRAQLLLDKIDGLDIDRLELQLSAVPLVAGPHYINVNEIMDQTSTKIYLNDLAPNVFSNGVESDEELVRNYDELYITGDGENVVLARALLCEIIAKTPIIYKDLVITFAKSDSLLLKFLGKIKGIMEKYAVFVQLPYLGACRSLVRVIGTSADSIEHAIGGLMRLTTDLFCCSYWIHTGEVSEAPPGAATTTTTTTTTSGAVYIHPEIELDINPYLDKICAASGATISARYKSSFEVTGLASETKRAMSMIRTLSIWEPAFQHQTLYQVELAVEHEEFIAGKGRGKITKIMHNANVSIRFAPFNEYNFYILLASSDFASGAAGIQLLEDELPSEIAFHIPINFHREVIGSGGHVVQAIMRRYNVFIKFNDLTDTYPNLIGVLASDNVLVRCPGKNSKNIPLARNDLLETVAERRAGHDNTFIYISRSHRRLILAENPSAINDIERKTVSVINFPAVEDPVGRLVEISGFGDSSEEASRMIKAILPDDYEFKVSYSPAKFEEACTSQEFLRRVVVPLRVKLFTETQVYVDPPLAKDEERYHRIVISFSAGHAVNLEESIQVITAYLRDKSLDIVDRGDVKWDPVEHGTASLKMYKRKNGGPGYGGGYDPNISGPSPAKISASTTAPPPAPPSTEGVYDYDYNDPAGPPRYGRYDRRNPPMYNQPGRPWRGYRY